MKFATRAIHVGQEADPTTGATVPPVYLTSTFTHEEVGKNKGYEYSRTGNPTRAALEQCLASLEEAEYGLAFASGSAASAAVLSLLRPGDCILAAEDLYGGTYRLFEEVLRPMGVSTVHVDGRDPAAFGKALSSSIRMIWVESPTNPLLQLVDLAQVAAIAHGAGVPLVVDNTFATPYNQRPLALGADIVVHSTTKYIGGHSDVIGGAVVTNAEDTYRSLKFYQNAAGAVPSPFDCWLLLRGVKTLGVRMDRHQANAMRVAEFLAEHPRVKSVIYPGLESHPQHALAGQQMDGFGGMVTFRIDGGRGEANRFFRSLELFSLAESLGGVESLACHPATMTHGAIPAAERERRGITEGTIRLSVGIEDAEDLVADLDHALGTLDHD